MIELGFNFVSSTVKEMTDISETRVENFESKNEKKKSFASSKVKFFKNKNSEMGKKLL